MMPGRAPRRLLRMWAGCVRGAQLASCLWLASLGFGAAHAQDACTPGDGRILAQACFLADPLPEQSYGHNILGDTQEWANLSLEWGPVADPSFTGDAPLLIMRLAAGSIFEDVAPRIIELNDDPLPEVLVVNSQTGQGARLLILDVNPDGVSSIAGPFIGQQNRWYAPLGVRDLDGDGRVEVAWIDRPHLARVLRIAQVQGSRLVEVDALDGLTNHRIGEDDIAGGIRDCGQGAEMIVATANWSQLVAVRWDGAAFERSVLGRDTSRAAFASAMACKD